MRNTDLAGTVEHRAPVWTRMRYWVLAHIADDFYQGLVPAAVPFFVLDRGYSYVGAAGLALAATLGSALPQPLLGVLVDRRTLVWLAPAGLATAATGAGLAGPAPTYWLVWTLFLVSGLGVAAFHPAAGRDARRAAGDNTTAMSLFAAGGSIGFFLAPALATPALVAAGVAGTALFVPPGVLMAFVLWRHQQRSRAATTPVAETAGRDRWLPFLILTAVAVVRSVVFTGLNTFLALHVIVALGASPFLGGAALTAFLVGGVLGTLTGGRIADRIGTVPTVRLGCAAAVPALLLLSLVDDVRWGLPAAVVAGITVNMPFAVIVKLGQDYVPARPGTAAGVTLGLAVSAGGLAVPVLGALADRSGPQAVLGVLWWLPLVALGLALVLPRPGSPADTCG